MVGVIALLVGLLTGIISGCGVGGGSLLMLYLTIGAEGPATKAAVVNLLYFIGCALPALRAHAENKLLCKSVAGRCIPAGLAGALTGALLAMWMDTGWLYRCFGVFLLYIGFKELFYRERKTGEETKPS